MTTVNSLNSPLWENIPRRHPGAPNHRSTSDDSTCSVEGIRMLSKYRQWWCLDDCRNKKSYLVKLLRGLQHFVNHHRKIHCLGGGTTTLVRPWRGRYIQTLVLHNLFSSKSIAIKLDIHGYPQILPIQFINPHFCCFNPFPFKISILSEKNKYKSCDVSNIKNILKQLLLICKEKKTTNPCSWLKQTKPNILPLPFASGAP